MKRIWFFALTVLLLFCTAGSRSTVASLDRAMVHAVGIDATENGVKLTLQVFRPDGTGGDTRLDAAKANILVISAEAPTTEQAMSECENRLGEYLFIGHCQIIVLGKGVDAGSTQKLFGCFLKSKETYLGMKLACTDGTAAELLSAELSEGAVAAQSLVNIIDRHVENSTTADCELLSAVRADNGCIVMPLLRLVKTTPESANEEKSGSGEDSEPNITVSAAGAKAFVSGSSPLRLSPGECMALSLLRGTCERIVLPLQSKEGEYGVKAELSRSAFSLSRQQDRLVCRFEIEAAVRADQSLDRLFDRSTLAADCERLISEECSALLQRSVSERADLAGICSAAKAGFPELWLECGSFEELCPLLEVQLGVRCEIN